MVTENQYPPPNDGIQFPSVVFYNISVIEYCKVLRCDNVTFVYIYETLL